MKLFDIFMKRTMSRERWMARAVERIAELAGAGRDSAGIARHIDANMYSILEAARLSGEEPCRAADLLHSVWRISRSNDPHKAERLLDTILAKWGMPVPGAEPFATFH